jgi:hypothetical protein
VQPGLLDKGLLEVHHKPDHRMHVVVVGEQVALEQMALVM